MDSIYKSIFDYSYKVFNSKAFIFLFFQHLWRMTCKIESKRILLCPFFEHQFTVVISEAILLHFPSIYSLFKTFYLLILKTNFNNLFD